MTPKEIVIKLLDHPRYYLYIVLEGFWFLFVCFVIFKAAGLYRQLLS